MNAWAKIVLKTAVSAVLIAFLLSKVDLQEVWETVRAANWYILSFAFCMFYIGYAITAARWHTLLRALGDSPDTGHGKPLPDERGNQADQSHDIDQRKQSEREAAPDEDLKPGDGQVCGQSKPWSAERNE